jgi:hypothetical protein
MSMVKCSGGCGRSIIAGAADDDGTWTCFACTNGAKRRKDRAETTRKFREIRRDAESDGYLRMGASRYPSDGADPANATNPVSDGDSAGDNALGMCVRCGRPIPRYRNGRKVRADTKTCPDNPACRQWLYDERKRNTRAGR